MNSEHDIISVAHAIQQSVAPVFLLTGVGAILSVLSSRLARVIDRLRLLEAVAADKRSVYEAAIKVLRRRARWIHVAITLSTVCALLICIVIAALFIGSELNRDPSSTIALCFIAAMLALTAGLLSFLREIALATGSTDLR